MVPFLQGPIHKRRAGAQRLLGERCHWLVVSGASIVCALLSAAPARAALPDGLGQPGAIVLGVVGALIALLAAWPQPESGPVPTGQKRPAGRGAPPIHSEPPAPAQPDLQAQRLQVIGTLSSAILHDVNNLLMIVCGSAELLDDAVAHSPKAHAELQALREAADHAAQIARQTVLLARPETEPTQILMMSALINQALPLLTRAAGPQAHLSVDLAPRLWPVRAGATQIVQLLLNLVVNAREALRGPGRVGIILRNYYGRPDPGCATGAYLRIEVSDSGPGMSDELRHQIFEPFFSTKACGSGAGLVLPTCAAISASLGGTIQVDSAPGRGARFSIYLPAVLDS